LKGSFALPFPWQKIRLSQSGSFPQGFPQECGKRNIVKVKL